jgi:F0F1-type ATP synthase assembly protein I
MQTKRPKKLPDEYLRWSGLAFKMMSLILLGFLAGKKLDSYIKSSFPLGTLVLGLGGFVLSFYSLIKEVTRKK